MVTRLTMASPTLARLMTTPPIHTATTVTLLVTGVNMTTHQVANPATHLPPTVSTMIRPPLIAIAAKVLSLADIAMTVTTTTIFRRRLTGGKSEHLGKL